MRQEKQYATIIGKVPYTRLRGGERPDRNKALLPSSGEMENEYIWQVMYKCGDVTSGHARSSLTITCNIWTVAILLLH